MERLIAPIGVGLLSLVLLAGTSVIAGEADMARGARLYSDNCARCHNLRAPSEHDDRDWPTVITHMRVVAGLPGDQARAILAFLQANNNPRRPEAAARRAPQSRALSGEELIARYGCQGCHVIDGEGGSVGPSLDTVFERREADWVRSQIRDPKSHNPATAMPDFGLSPEQANAIIRALRGGE